MISIINLGEILYITDQRGSVSKAQSAPALIQQLPIKVLSADEKGVFSTAHVKANYAISYADSFVVAATVEKDAVIQPTILNLNLQR
ncbi:MAG: hypothetical protein WAN58_15850 [Anaerolineales bacterium]